MDPTLHTKLWRGDNAFPITLEEWREAAAGLPAFHITDKLKQQNPFTIEYVFFDVPGSGYWQFDTLPGPVWSGDDVVWFSFSGGKVVFIQFSDLNHPDLQQLVPCVPVSRLTGWVRNNQPMLWMGPPRVVRFLWYHVPGRVA